MKIEISIWGIRRGFEKEGFFHTHNNATIKASQQDRFRKICNSIGNKGFFNIQHIQGKTVISYIDSGVREFLPAGPRPGYAVFSLIISNQEVFEQSPRAVLLELSHFYRSRVGESNQNNFNSAEIEFFLNKLTLTSAKALQIRENISSYTYYADASHIDNYLTGNIPFASFGELIFIPSEYNPTTGKFKELDFIDDSFRSNPQYIDLRVAESRFMKERENDLEKQRIAEQQKKEMQQQIQFIEQDLKNMIELGKFDEAIRKFDQFPYKSSIDQRLNNRLNEYKRVKENQEKEVHTLKQDAELIDSIIIADRQGDLELALNRYKRLNNKNHANLTFNLKTKLENYDADLKQQRESEEQQKISKAEAKNAVAKRKKMVLILSILAVIGLSATSFFLKVPTSVWDKDGDSTYNWSDACPLDSGSLALNGCPDKDKDGFADQDDKCPNDASRVCQGCPDGDKDNVPDKIDSCKTEPGSKDCFGCPDNDNDKIADKDDKCPNLGGDVDEKGCPKKAQVTPPLTGMNDISNTTINTKNYTNLKKIFGQRFVKLVGNHYEISKHEFTEYKKINNGNEIYALNNAFGKNIPGSTPPVNPPKGGGTNGGGTNTPGVTTVNHPPKNPSETSSSGLPISFPANKIEELTKLKEKYNQETDILRKKEIKSKILTLKGEYNSGILSNKYKDEYAVQKLFNGF